MQKVKLPQFINPRKDAQKRSEYCGYYPLNKLSRLQESVSEIISDADACFNVYLDDQGLTILEGYIATEVLLNCQRCNNDFNYHLKAEFKLCALRSLKNIDDIPECYEVVECNEFNELDLEQSLIDELILALPLIAKHEESQCETQAFQQSFGQLPDEVDEKPNPFEKLAQLKNLAK